MSGSAVLCLAGFSDSRSNITKHLIASSQWPNAESKAEAFEIVAQEGMLPRTLADSFHQAARFLNLVTHQTTKVDDDVVYDVFTEQFGDFEQFAAHLAQWLGRRHDEDK